MDHAPCAAYENGDRLVAALWMCHLLASWRSQQLPPIGALMLAHTCTLVARWQYPILAGTLHLAHL